MKKQPTLPSHAMRECVPVWLAGLLLCIHCGFAVATCTGSEQVQAAASPAAVVEKPVALAPDRAALLRLQLCLGGIPGVLWNDTAGRVEDEAVKWLQAFPGAVYRYPGGTESNYFDWKSAVGPKEQRAPRKAVKWKGPLVDQVRPRRISGLRHAGRWAAMVCGESVRRVRKGRRSAAAGRGCAASSLLIFVPKVIRAAPYCAGSSATNSIGANISGVPTNTWPRRGR